MAARLRASDVNSSAVRKRIENHTFEDEEGDEYEGSKFGGFPEYFRRKKIKLQNRDVGLRSSAAENPNIFRGVVAHVNGYTQPSLNDLHTLIVSHGGGFMQYLDGKTTVTHIIASNLTLKKKVEFRRYRVVKPAWVPESVKAGRLLPWDDFRLIDEGEGQKVLGFEDGKVISATTQLQRGYRYQTDGSWYESQAKAYLEGLSADSGSPRSVNPSSSSRQERPSDKADELFATASEEHGMIIDFARREREVSETGLDESLATSMATPDKPLSTIPHATPLRLNESNDPAAQPPSLEVTACRGDPTDRESGENGEPMQEEDATDELPSPFNIPIHPRPSEAASPSKMAVSAEEHNSRLLADPHMRKMSAVNPEFLKQYYQESRLHHLSTWKADLKSRMQQLANEKSSSQKVSLKRKSGSKRYILHVDFDCFFAAVSLRAVPQYAERPVVVAHGSGPGSEIASCNYPARAFGVKNGMWMKRAQELCSDLKVLPYDFKAYEEASRSFYEAILSTGGIVQSVSIDEALVDISALCDAAGGSDGTGVSEGSIWREQEKAASIAQELRELIKEKTGCAVSIGIGGNILLAKVALRKAKPAGQHQIKPEEVLEFIGEMNVRDLPGVAYSIGGKLEDLGVTYVKDIRDVPRKRLISFLGPKTGERIWEYSRGIDRTEVGQEVTRKSVSAEVNWGIRFENHAQADEFIRSLCDELHRRLVENNVKGRQMTMKIMRRAADAPLDPPKHLGHGKCDTFNKSVTLGIATNSTDILSKEALSILKGYGFSPGELRGLGIQMTRLEPLKPQDTGSLDSSQKKLQFKLADVARTPQRPAEDPIDDTESPPRGREPVTPVMKTPLSGEEQSSHKPLNIQGTQFILPSQVDPEVLAELPLDIRANLLRQAHRSGRQTPSRSPSRSHSPSTRIPFAPSSPDQAILDTLPDDIRREVLESYRTDPSKRMTKITRNDSPRRKQRPDLKKHTTPTKRKVGLASRGRAKVDQYSTLTQSNFLAVPAGAKKGVGGQQEEFEGVEEVSTDFLDALPEDIRREVIAQHKRERLQRRGHLDVQENFSAIARRNRIKAEAQSPTKGRVRIQAPAAKPTFTTKKLSSLSEMRDVVSAWVEEFKHEGPYEEDVQSLVSYLSDVVTDERNVEKAVGIAKWMDWAIDARDVSGKGNEGWQKALSSVKAAVQTAVRKRGLGLVEL